MTMLLSRVLGFVLAFIGFVFFVVSLVALVDPAGTQLADDSDPFGRPPPWYAAVIGMVISAGAGAGGIWRLRSRERAGG